MNRVLVLGSPGAGKTTFSRRLAALTGRPAIHLDQYFWRPGWVKPAPDAWTKQVTRLAAEPYWIMDGNYARTLPLRLMRADTIILLDLPRPLCLTRVIRRMVWDLGRTRDDLPPGCPERLDWPFLRYIWNFRRTDRPILLTAMDHFIGTRVVLKTQRDIDDYLAALHGTADALPASQACA